MDFDSDEELTYEEMEERAAQADDEARLAALGRGGGSDSIRELREQKERNETEQNSGMAKMGILTMGIMFFVIGVAVFALMSLKS